MAHTSFIDPSRDTAKHALVPCNPKITFMSLPFEIRDQIYHLALISPLPIIVWKAHWVYEPSPPISEDEDLASYHNNHTYTWCRNTDYEATTNSVSSLSTNLLFCSKTVSEEVAEVFYSKNTFAFRGDHDWDPIVWWLRVIGLQNRNHLSSLEINAYKPDEVWQQLTGERVEHPGGFTKNKIYLRSPYLAVRMRPFKFGLVDNINPALETVFELLGQRLSTRKMLLTFRLEDQYPGQGAIYQEGDQCPENGWQSLDLPNLIEKFRMIYTPQENFEVLWRGKCPRISTSIYGEFYSKFVIAEYLENIADSGWEIEFLGTKEDDCVFRVRVDSFDAPTYILRKKKLVEPLLGSDPNLYSGIYIRLGSEEDHMRKVTGWYDEY